LLHENWIQDRERERERYSAESLQARIGGSGVQEEKEGEEVMRVDRVQTI
jgi:hypothetical protein